MLEFRFSVSCFVFHNCNLYINSDLFSTNSYCVKFDMLTVVYLCALQRLSSSSVLSPPPGSSLYLNIYLQQYFFPEQATKCHLKFVVKYRHWCSGSGVLSFSISADIMYVLLQYFNGFHHHICYRNDYC
jgi:hypothetical protein